MKTTDELVHAICDRNVAAAVTGIAVAPAIVHGRESYLGSTPLHFAAHRGLAPVVSALLEAGADVHARELASGTTALHWAGEAGHPQVVDLLVARGAALEVNDEWFELSPLGWCAVVSWAPQFRCDKDSAQARLVAAGAKLDLFSAVVIGTPAAVQELASVDPTLLARRLGYVGDAMQPLHMAVARGRAQIVQALIDAGANAHARTALGLSVKALALRSGQDKIVELLARHDAHEDASVRMVRGDVKGMDALLADEKGPDAAHASDLLLCAAEDGADAAARCLIARGADPSIASRGLLGERPGMLSAVHRAARGGHAGVLAALLDAGAKADGGSAPGDATPLHLAAGAGQVAAVTLLLVRGADPQARESGFGGTARGWAEHAGQKAVAALLPAEES